MFGNYEKVLVVDDCEFLRRRLDKELRAHGYTVQTACDGVEALKLVEGQEFDFIITDWDMPNLDGELLCRCLRTEGKFERYLYIIMMTAHTEIDAVAGFAAGVDDFLLKPINVSELLARMQAGVRILQRDRKMANAVERDPLTGLFNRRSLAHRMQVSLDNCHRIGRPMSCIMLDLDRFKQINDELGHTLGDTVIVSVAESLKLLFRANDDIFRYGGEEFLIVLPDTDIENATLCAERCRSSIEALNLESVGVDRKITASVGVAQTIPSERSSIDLVDRADAALLLAKKSGRNCTVTDEQLLESTEKVADIANG